MATDQPSPPPAGPVPREWGLARLRELRLADPETGHMEADRILLDLIGDPEIREAFEALSKWYA